MSVLVIGDTSLTTRNIAVLRYGSGELLDRNNFFLADFAGATVYFTALGDLDFDQMVEAAMQCDTVDCVYSNLEWSDQGARVQTEILCNFLSHRITVVGWELQVLDRGLTQSVTRVTDDPVIWTFGCSTTKGAGLVNPDQEVFGALLSKRLNRKWINVAQNGSSTKWSLQHILAADIRPNDIVIWAATSPERYRKAMDFETTTETLLSDADRTALDFYTDPQIYLEHMDTVIAGVSFLRGIKSQFVFMDMLHLSPYLQLLEKQFSRFKEWCPTHDWNRYDRGTDKLHIGPTGHINLANRIENHIKLLNYV
jgi:hypothetical protein